MKGDMADEKTPKSKYTNRGGNPFCKCVIESLPDGWRRTRRCYCSDPCKVDGYALRRVRKLLKVGIIRFHDLLEEA